MESFGVPVLLVLFVAFFIGIILGPILYIQKLDDQKPISYRKCNGIRETVDPHVRWSSSLNICSVSKYDDKNEKIIGFTTYTTENGRIIRKEVML